MNWHWLRHDWGKWEVIQEGGVATKYSDIDEWVKTGRYSYQKRACRTCSFTELRTVRTNLG